jgi:hypothetical protein
MFASHQVSLPLRAPMGAPTQMPVTVWAMVLAIKSRYASFIPHPHLAAARYAPTMRTAVGLDAFGRSALLSLPNSESILTSSASAMANSVSTRNPLTVPRSTFQRI